MEPTLKKEGRDGGRRERQREGGRDGGRYRGRERGEGGGERGGRGRQKEIQRKEGREGKRGSKRKDHGMFMHTCTSGSVTGSVNMLSVCHSMISLPHLTLDWAPAGHIAQ